LVEVDGKTHPVLELNAISVVDVARRTRLTIISRFCPYRSQLKRNTGAETSPYSTAERRLPEPIPALGSQPAGDASHKPGSRLHYFLPGLQLHSQPLRGLLPISLQWSEFVNVVECDVIVVCLRW